MSAAGKGAGVEMPAPLFSNEQPSDEELWSLRTIERRELVNYVRRRMSTSSGKPMLPRDYWPGAKGT